MPKFAANLTMMYNEYAFPERFAAAARDGFAGVEFLFPYAHLAGELQALLQEHGLEQVLFNFRRATGTRASAGSHRCRRARGNSSAESRARSITRRRSVRAACM